MGEREPADQLEPPVVAVETDRGISTGKVNLIGHDDLRDDGVVVFDGPRRWGAAPRGGSEPDRGTRIRLRALSEAAPGRRWRPAAN